MIIGFRRFRSWNKYGRNLAVVGALFQTAKFSEKLDKHLAYENCITLEK